MSEPHSSMSKEPLSDEELRKFRYHMQFMEQNDSLMRRLVMIVKSWWLLPLGVIIAVSGTIGTIVEFIASKAGM